MSISDNFYLAPRNELRWILVDLDGTLAEEVWPDPGIGLPIQKNIKKLDEAVKQGYKIIIYTSRHWMDYEMIQKWLDLHLIPHKEIICGKPLVHKVIDDKNVHPDADQWY